MELRYCILEKWIYFKLYHPLCLDLVTPSKYSALEGNFHEVQHIQWLKGNLTNVTNDVVSGLFTFLKNIFALQPMFWIFLLI